jgi:cation diffusion facilitator CzcD-associated flavoprotein CzcO
VQPRRTPAELETDSALPSNVDVAVVGAGFSGLGAAIKLKKAGRDFVVLERGDDVGGTWRDNTYPGCRCDVPSHLYSFSFAPNPDWSASFSPQPEIQEYLRRTAREFGLVPSIHLGTEVREARWDGDARRWRLRTSRGDLTARVLVAGAGPLSEPRLPDIPGVDRFEGTAFHSAAWRHDHDLAGEHVAVVGTGASAVQLVPHVQRRAAHLTVFQRTPAWVMPRRDRRIGRAERALYRRAPAVQRFLRSSIYWGRESWILGFAVRPDLMRVAERMALRHLQKQVPDAKLRAQLTPRYRLGCKRVVLENDFYPALQRPNAALVTDPIVEILPRGIMTAAPDGTRTEHPVDTIVFATGFHVTDPPIAEGVFDGAGRSLAERWRESGMSALHGTTVAGFPNLFLLVGPNTGLGHTSIVLMIEAQVAYLLDALRRMDATRIDAIEPRPEVQEAHNARLQRRLARTVWNAGGCASWYLDERGRNTTLWPTFTFTFRRRLRRCDLGEYVTHPQDRRREGVAA